jgi:predicted lipoprotein with Yx(FWY)xxD motif
MTRSLVAGLTVAAAAGLLAGCASGNGSAPASGAGGTGQQAAGMTIATRAVAGVGTVLTDQSGKTLYTPEQEAQHMIKCTGSCLSFWFPVAAGSGAAPRASASVTGTFGSVQRPDGGVRQLTYDGKPLYTFKLDAAPGQAHGNDFTDHFGGQTFTWHAVTAAGAAPAPAASQAGTPSGYSSYQGGSGGY